MPELAEHSQGYSEKWHQHPNSPDWVLLQGSPSTKLPSQGFQQDISSTAGFCFVKKSHSKLKPMQSQDRSGFQNSCTSWEAGNSGKFINLGKHLFYMRNFSTDDVALNNWKENYFLLHVDLQANYHASHSIPNSNPWQPSIKQPSSAQNPGGGPLEWAAIATDWNLKAHTHKFKN